MQIDIKQGLFSIVYLIAKSSLLVITLQLIELKVSCLHEIQRIHSTNTRNVGNIFSARFREHGFGSILTFVSSMICEDHNKIYTCACVCNFALLFYV